MSAQAGNFQDERRTSVRRGVEWSAIRRAASADRLATALVLAWATFAYAAAHRAHFAVLANPQLPRWWEWADQGRYYRAAQAWAQWSFDPSQHWYFAGYPLMGAALFHFMPGQPFYLVDLICLLLFGAALLTLSGRLAQSAARGRLVGAGVFLLTVVLTPFALKSFVEPWTTTPTAPLSLAAFLLAFRLWDRPSARLAALLGLCTTAIVLFRPSDTAPLAAAVLGTSVIALKHLGPRRLLGLATSFLGGAAIPVALAGVTYGAVFGLARSPYLQQSAATGFEWRLIPLQWVTIFVSPLPEFREEFSLSQTFAWVIPGMAGMVACLLAQQGRARLRHALVIAAVALHSVLYLAYRDLHPQGLFRFGNYHYFKWCLPVFGLYAVFLLTEIVGARRRAAAWGASALLIAAAFSWRMMWQDVPALWLADARLRDPHTLVLPHLPPTVSDGLFVPADGGFSQIYLSSYVIQVGGRVLSANADFKAFPVEGGLVLMELRPPPGGQAVIRFPDEVTLRPEPLQLRHAHLFLRWPHVRSVLQAYLGRWLWAGEA